MFCLGVMDYTQSSGDVFHLCALETLEKLINSLNLWWKVSGSKMRLLKKHRGRSPFIRSLPEACSWTDFPLSVLELLFSFLGSVET